jgi:hypothetical protein
MPVAIPHQEDSITKLMFAAANNAWLGLSSGVVAPVAHPNDSDQRLWFIIAASL